MKKTSWPIILCIVCRLGRQRCLFVEIGLVVGIDLGRSAVELHLINLIPP